MVNGLPSKELSDLLFEHDYAAQVLREHFRIEGLDGLGLGSLPAATAAAGAALRYLADCQRSRPAQVQSVEVDRPDGILHLDRETVGHLELFQSLRAEDKESTLFHHLDETRTPMGRRLLAHWMRAPLCDLDAIRERHDAVEWLCEQARQLSAARDALRGMGDLSRSASRIATERAQPAELGSLRSALERLPAVETALSGATAPSAHALRGKMDFAKKWCERLQRELVAEPPANLRKGGVFLEGVDAQLDELRGLSYGGKQWIADYQTRERERSGIPTLKVGYNKVFGYHIEVTNTHLAKVPDDYEEKQKLTNAKRFVTVELNERERQILRADEDLIAKEVELFEALRSELATTIKDLQELSHAVAEVDTLCSLAHVAANRGFVRPSMTEGRELEVVAGRHPVVERLVDEPFVPNDLHMDPEDAQLLLLTGPNMGGKSTYLRQSALFVLLAQMGSFVPAKSATMGLVDRLFTRVGASDDLARGKSTFLVEMAETANILRNATGRSLVILDEVGRGTSTDDGLALAWAISEYLHDGPQQPKTLFATHFHELTALVETLPRAANLQMQVKEWENEILFLHTVISGASDRSYGVHVARLAGVPQPVLERAREILARPEIVHGDGVKAAKRAPQEPLPLFEPRVHPLIERLQALNPDEMRPLDALQILAQLRDEFRD
jgi:DNA mismatch repair protein MutS